MEEKTYLNELLDHLKKTITKDSQAVVFLEAGHFNPRYGVTEFSKTSLEDAIYFIKILIKEFNRNIKVVLGILVDDLGLECTENSCHIPLDKPLVSENNITSLPQELEDILSCSALVKRDRLIISSEKTCKNRGLLKLKKLVKSEFDQDVITLVENNHLTKVQFEDLDKNHILLAEFSNSIWKAKCPSIMGQHYIDCFSKMHQRFNHIQKLIIIDWTEMLDYSKVVAGSQAALKVFRTDLLASSDLEIFNVFFCDNSGDIYEITQFKNPLLLEQS